MTEDAPTLSDGNFDILAFWRSLDSALLLQIQTEIGRTVGAGDFVLQIDQVEYWTVMNENEVDVVADNRLACRDRRTMKLAAYS